MQGSELPTGAEFAPWHDAAWLLADMKVAALDAARFVASRAQDAAELRWETKSRADFVSEVDTSAEARIRDLLRERAGARSDAPAVTFVGEELSPEHTAGEGVTFVVDPLDGTTNFLHGYPWYAISIAALVGGTLAAAVVHNVPTGDVFAALQGGGAFRNGSPIRVSTLTDPLRALVGTGFPFKSLDRLDQYQRQFAAVIRGTAGIRRAGSAALDLCDVACGRFDAFWELVLAPWDAAAGMLIVREAGGLVTDLSGEPATVAHGSYVAGNPVMHAWLLAQLRAADGHPRAR